MVTDPPQQTRMLVQCVWEDGATRHMQLMHRVWMPSAPELPLSPPASLEAKTDLPSPSRAMPTPPLPTQPAAAKDGPVSFAHVIVRETSPFVWGGVGYCYHGRSPGATDVILKFARTGEVKQLEREAACYEEHLRHASGTPACYGLFRDANYSLLVTEDVGTAIESFDDLTPAQR